MKIATAVPTAEITIVPPTAAAWMISWSPITKSSPPGPPSDGANTMPVPIAPTMPPHSLTLTMVGTGLLWVGWFGFNAGSALSAGGVAGLAFINTILATGAATIAWSGIASTIVFTIIKLIFGIRVSPEVEEEGLDISEHGERAYHS